LLGYYWFGFQGFLWGSVVANLVVLTYFYREQKRQGLLDSHAEWARAGWALGVFVVCLVSSVVLVHFLPTGLLHHAARRP
jgi:hypothetical protein